jgi:hypothetical protein
MHANVFWISWHSAAESLFDNAEEMAENVNVRIVGHLASVELDFCLIMGPNKMRGTDLFNLAHRGGKWVIVHKSY